MEITIIYMIGGFVFFFGIFYIIRFLMRILKSNSVMDQLQPSMKMTEQEKMDFRRLYRISGHSSDDWDVYSISGPFHINQLKHFRDYMIGEIRIILNQSFIEDMNKAGIFFLHTGENKADVALLDPKKKKTGLLLVSLNGNSLLEKMK